MDGDFERARQLYQADREAAALPYLARYLAEEPDSAEGWVLLSRCHHALDNDTEALQAARRGVALDPEEASAHNALADALGSFDPQGAVRASRRALELQPDHWYRHCHLGWQLLRTGEHAEARVHAEKALELEPEQPVNHRLLACVEELSGDQAAAADCWRRVLSLDPEDAGALQWLGEHGIQYGKIGDAIHVLSNAAALDPSDSNHRNHVDWALMMLARRLWSGGAVSMFGVFCLVAFTQVNQPWRPIAGTAVLAGLWLAGDRMLKRLPKGARLRLSTLAGPRGPLRRRAIGLVAMGAGIAYLSYAPRLAPMAEWNTGTAWLLLVVPLALSGVAAWSAREA
ncbi:tetratricopeptide repeat protein [Longispora albida]|uniref:tetratricopeptide repeat protein n=1 Tax=Longispora albida TaxID=203523 RepID=UPI0003A343F4|nr:tetratricopeptide repeat protein [Longispora albida]